MSIFSVICSISLAYLLSILFLYSCFYTLHIPYSFYNLLFFMFYYIFFHILLYFYILSIIFMCSSFMSYHISYTYITFMVIYYTICYILFSCIVIMYCVHILFSYYTFHITFSFMYCTCSYTFHVIDTLLLVLVYLSYYHRIVVLCFSYRVIYSLHFICRYLSFSFMFHVCINLRSGYRKNCLYPKELYIPEGIITVRDSELCPVNIIPEGIITVRDSDLCPVILYPKVSSLYETVTYAL